MSETIRTVQDGECWPQGREGKSGRTTLSTHPKEIPVFDCTRLTSTNMCKLTRRRCDLLPVFINQDDLISCETAAGRLMLDSVSGDFTSPYGTGTLRRSEAALLEKLMQVPGALCTRIDLYRALNPKSNYLPKTLENVINVRISNLRKQLGDEPIKPGQARARIPLIETINQSGEQVGGYRLITTRRRSA